MAKFTSWQYWAGQVLKLGPEIERAFVVQLLAFTCLINAIKRNCTITYSLHSTRTFMGINSFA